ncbi:UNVERIFIED_CONTAM: hypothetical protein RMT77_017436 [Armadillidium vulgare]
MNIRVQFSIWCLLVLLKSSVSSSEEETPSLKMKNHSNGEDGNQGQFRGGKFFPFNVKSVLFPSGNKVPIFGNGIKNQKNSFSSNDDIRGRLFKLFSTSNIGVDPSHILISTLSSNIPRITAAIESIAQSFDTISSEWQFAFNEMFTMGLIQALEQIAMAINDSQTQR